MIYEEVILELEKEKCELLGIIQEKDKAIAELKTQVEEMKSELHRRLISPSHGDSDCLNKIYGLDRLWQFGEEF